MPPSLCPKCGQLVGSNETKCFKCGTPKVERRRPIEGVDMFPAQLILGACVLLYVVSIILDTQAALNPKGGLLAIGSPNSDALKLLGMTGGNMWRAGHYWTLLSASFLHGSILHIFFNMSWFSTLSKVFTKLFGAHRLVIVFVLTGVSGFLLSNVMSNYPTIGASCSIFGIMGALLVFSYRRGGEFGRIIRGQVWAWIIIGLVFGFAIPGINNYGHVGGLLGGAAMGYVLPQREGVAEEKWVKPMAYVLLVASLLSVLMSIRIFWPIFQIQLQF